MKRRNATRKALVASVVSLLLCVSMLVGTTFAWFTDEVTTGMNTIAAGNLDIELLADGAKVDSTTALFDDIELWEPGVVAYENLQVANVGTLALKYQMSLNFGNENDLNGHKLSEVLKVAVIDKVADDATREEVLALAQAAVAADQGKGTLSNFYLTGELLPGDTTAEQSIVIFWAPNDNATDNLYNANNGQKTSDGEPLSIEFGINLQATQKMYEEDSFGNDYDEGATILPKATVNGLPGEALAVIWGIGGEEGTLNAPFKMQFQPNEQLTDPDGIEDSGDEYLASEYAKWHADFVVYADRDVPAGTMALAGFYNEWCQMIDGKWVALRNDGMAIEAGEQVRLVAGMASGMSVNYEEICRYGNDGTGFLCTAADLTGANAGTTITVELRLYETLPYGLEEHDLGDGNICHGNTANCETGYYEVVGTYTYTFVNAVSTAAELKEQLAKGNDVTLANDIIVDVAETGFVVAKGASAKIDLNGHDIIATSTSAANTQLFSVSGNLEIVGNGTISLNNDNFAWNTSARYTAINIRETGVVTLGEGVKVVCEGGSATADGYGMTYAVDIYTTGTLNVNGASLHSNYIAVRCFYGNSVVNVGSGSSITSSKNNYGIWLQSAPGAVITIDSSVTYTVDSNGIYIFG